MYRYLMLAMLSVASANLFAQDASAIAAQREAEERERRTTAMIERLQESNNVQQRRINELNNDISALRRQLVEFENRYKNAQLGAVSQSDLRKVYETIDKVEKSRQADNELVKEQFQALKKLLDKPLPVYVPPVAPPTPHDTKTNKPDRTEEPQVQEFNGEYYGYKIKSGDRLMAIISAYNLQLKEKGKAPITLEMVKKANPKLNPNNLPVGREIKIPIPPDK